MLRRTVVRSIVVLKGVNSLITRFTVIFRLPCNTNQGEARCASLTHFQSHFSFVRQATGGFDDKLLGGLNEGNTPAVVKSYA